MTIIKAQLDLHTVLFNNCIDGINEEQAWERANENVNPIIWMAGHLVGTRMSMSSFGGFEPDNSFDGFFGHDQKLDTSKTYPSLAAIKEAWNDISEKISKGIGNMPQEAWASPSPSKMPIADDTMAGFMAFLMHHEAYHIGQMGILRKFAGAKAMSYRQPEAAK
ncbi:MAG: DinB family protein [Flavobacteriales bacterium]|nr:DinB family protein [Flavobacteriales bacterium]